MLSPTPDSLSGGYAPCERGAVQSQVQSSVWPVGVVMVDVDAEDVLELSSADDQDPVEAVAADGSDPTFGERVRFRRPERCANDLDALASKDVVEGAAELAVSVADEEADRCRTFRE